MHCPTPAWLAANSRRVIMPAVTLLICVGCAGVRPSSPATSPPLGASAPVSTTASGPNATLRAQGYTTDYHIKVTLASGQQITVFHSICTGSADGHCQDVDAFDGEGRSVWRRHYVDVLRLTSKPGGFDVRSADYRPSDPLCCPSGGTMTEEYVWSGTTFQRSNTGPVTTP